MLQFRKDGWYRGRGRPRPHYTPARSIENKREPLRSIFFRASRSLRAWAPALPVKYSLLFLKLSQYLRIVMRGKSVAGSYPTISGLSSCVADRRDPLAAGKDKIERKREQDARGPHAGCVRSGSRRMRAFPYARPRCSRTARRMCMLQARKLTTCATSVAPPLRLGQRRCQHSGD